MFLVTMKQRKSKNPRTELLKTLVNKTERKIIEAAARKRGESVSRFLRVLALEASALEDRTP
jgi:uncharacterized protein (DUF1778 family)